MNLVDSSDWIEYFSGGLNAGFLAPPIKRTTQLIVSVICLYEVFKRIHLVVSEKRALEATGLMKSGRIIEIDEYIGMKAASISLKKKLPMADSLIYATAQAYGADLWAQDEHMKNLPGVRYKAAAKKIGN